MPFPKQFLWGAATASYQIEGAVQADGRGESIWDRFSHTPGKTVNGDTGDVACDHYHRYKEDVRLMAELGLQSYRFSVAWPRIFPTGAGAPNPKGIDFYKRLVDELHRYKIKPALTLYHWDLPQALEEKGGWTNRETAYRFAEYADYLFRALGDQVPLWITHNEPWCAAFLGYAMGVHAPGAQDWAKAVQASHHLLLSHGLAVQAFRAAAPKAAQVGITLNLAPAYPGGERPEDLAAARLLDGFQNRWWLDPLFKGQYPADLIEYFSQFGALDYIQPDDLALIQQPIDLLGINYYQWIHVKGNPDSPYFRAEGMPIQNPVTAMGWEVVPESLYDLLVRIKRDYGDLPLYITENGAAYPDAVNEAGEVVDPERIEFLRAHFAAAERATADGVNLAGFYVWSLLDNFEWAFGYEKRFGIVYVDYESQQRIPKGSATWYSQVIKANGLG